ncbi:hypothetical protein MK280_04900, partial [Myxococcota bacterium]|nr:hypothetical protein [Myxococcota bacterium]
FFSRDYGASVQFLGQWVEAGDCGANSEWVKQALAGLLHIEALRIEEEDREVIESAAALASRLKTLSSA